MESTLFSLSLSGIHTARRTAQQSSCCLRSIRDPIRAPPPKLGVGNPQSKLIANCGQTVSDRPTIRVVCIDSLWELNSLPNGTIVDPLGAPLPQNWGNHKIKLNTAAKPQQTLKGFVMQSVGSH